MPQPLAEVMRIGDPDFRVRIPRKEPVIVASAIAEPEPRAVVGERWYDTDAPVVSGDQLTPSGNRFQNPERLWG